MSLLPAGVSASSVLTETASTTGLEVVHILPRRFNDFGGRPVPSERTMCVICLTSLSALLIAFLNLEDPDRAPGAHRNNGC
jgi:hypothetical protein